MIRAAGARMRFILCISMCWVTACRPTASVSVWIGSDSAQSAQTISIVAQVLEHEGFSRVDTDVDSALASFQLDSNPNLVVSVFGYASRNQLRVLFLELPPEASFSEKSADAVVNAARSLREPFGDDVVHVKSYGVPRKSNAERHPHESQSEGVRKTASEQLGESMWNPFRKKTRNNSPQPPKPPGNAVNRIDELANTLQREGRISDLEQELNKQNQSGLSPAEHESWWHLYGIVAFQAKRDAEALERFEEAYRRFPHSAQIRFSLGQQCIRAGSIERGFELFRACRFPEVPCEYALAQARYAYLWSRYSDARLFIRPFFEAYMQVKILDDHFLYVRGLPFFGRWWSYLAAFSVLADDFSELDSVTQFVLKNCSDYDFDHLEKQLKAYREDEPSQLLSALEKRLSEMPAGNFPTGYTRMNIAVIKARAARSMSAVRDVLAEVVLSENDFPWLEDIRTLALAEAAHRLGDPIVEQQYVQSFLLRQPMLFEPDIALNFHLLQYQEKLKSRIAA